MFAQLLQSCWTCNPMGCSLSGSSVLGNSPGKNTGMGCHALLQGFFPTQGWNRASSISYIGSQFPYLYQHASKTKYLYLLNGLPKNLREMELGRLAFNTIFLNREALKCIRDSKISKETCETKT